MSLAEYNDILKKKAFDLCPGQMEKKWFADTLEGVKLHAEKLFEKKGEPYRIAATEIPDARIAGLYRDENMDRFGPATCLDPPDFEWAVPILELEP